MNVAVPAHATAARPGRQLPAWTSVLAVVAHPDDESFGLGAVIDALAAAGAAVHILCYTHGEASTLNETRADLRRAREQELTQAGAELGAASVTLLDYPDGRLAEIAPDELAAHAAAAAARGKAAVHVHAGSLGGWCARRWRPPWRRVLRTSGAPAADRETAPATAVLAVSL
jgi:LmbE family N-acetylglucosaminyl deacetylase